MIRISKRLEQIVRKELSKNLIPQKTDNGILVGDILISSHHNLKFLSKKDTVIYSQIHLNSVAIKIANLLALRKSSILADRLFLADQDYGRLYVDSHFLRAQYQHSAAKNDYNKADILWARYCESRDRCILAKKYVESLLQVE